MKYYMLGVATHYHFILGVWYIMKRFAKAFVVSGITLGAILGLNVTEHNGVSNEAKAQTAHS